ncbi:nif-specific transcriptional activator NifA [Paludibacterium yongneupense]|uniref:nif-specific transcriptional activator NifA n=1 Tax=Paludibacterium yongneupense TaxID=400061 RepID=UPI000413C523|nr:nif-specific transcriptional activator NifA [Paludibacterium yongneupense]
MDYIARSHAEEELITVYEIGKILNSSLDINKTFRESLNVLVMQLDFRRGMIVLKESEQELSVFAAVGLTQEEAARGHFQSGEGVIGRVYASGMPAVVPDISAEPLFLNRTYSSQAPDPAVAFVAVPIKIGNESQGVLAIDRWREEGSAFRDTLRVLSMISTLLGQTLRLRQNVSAAQQEMLMATRRPHNKTLHINKVVGVSQAMQDVFQQVHKVGPSRSTVLLRGESGSGKEVIARAIHDLSPRSKSPFIKVNCAALSETLLESELFGHEKGAFTGAVAERKGRFEQANGGTLFLDEIGDISPAFQAKMLRVLQEREFERVGGNRSVKVDVRLICATNRNLEKMVVAGTFRADLYYRINVVSVFLPPLRERREDIPPLVSHFLDRYNRENGRSLRLQPDALRLLMNCYWPGNVRELENCIERTATMATGDAIQALAFPCHKDRCLTQLLHYREKDDAVAPARAQEPAASEAQPVAAAAPDAASPRPQGERERLLWAMERSGWVQAKAARLLNITPRQMGYALQKHGIEVRKF